MVLINLFIVLYINKERYIYFFDNYNYWSKYQYLSEIFRNNPYNALQIVFHSIRYDDYNLFPVFFLIPFNLIFGDERLAFILSILNIMAIPSIYMMTILIDRISESDLKKSTVFLISILTFVLIPQFWTPIVRGEVGVIGVFIIGLIYLIYIKAPIDKQSVSNLILMGFLLFILIILRRWYAFWVVSFLIALVIETSIFLLPQYGLKIKNYIPYAKNIFIIGAVFSFLFFLIATPIAKSMIFTDYSDIYSAYKKFDLIDSILLLSKAFGFLIVILFICGFTKLILNNHKRNFAIFLLTQLITSYLLFIRTQDIWSQHLYLFIPTIIIFISFLIISVFQNIDNKIIKSIFLIAFILMSLINFSVALSPEASDNFKKIDFLLSGSRYYPLVRNDLGEINNLLNVLEKDLLKNENDSVYILSSSGIFSDEILRNACHEKGNPALCNKIYLTHHVDKRDGFPFQFFNAKYVIITNPIQYHLKPDDQRVIVILSGLISNQSNIGRSYKKLPYRFVLEKNVEVYIYEKMEPYNKSDLITLSQLFINYYPDNKYGFLIDPEAILQKNDK